MNVAQTIRSVSVYTKSGAESYRFVGADRVGFMRSRVNKSPIRHGKESDM